MIPVCINNIKNTIKYFKCIPRQNIHLSEQKHIYERYIFNLTKIRPFRNVQECDNNNNKIKKNT